MTYSTDLLAGLIQIWRSRKPTDFHVDRNHFLQLCRPHWYIHFNSQILRWVSTSLSLRRSKDFSKFWSAIFFQVLFSCQKFPNCVNNSLSKSAKVCQIRLQTMPKSVKSCQAVLKTLTVIYILFAADRVLTGKRQRKRVNFEW